MIYFTTLHIFFIQTILANNIQDSLANTENDSIVSVFHVSFFIISLIIGIVLTVTCTNCKDKKEVVESVTENPAYGIDQDYADYYMESGRVGDGKISFNWVIQNLKHKEINKIQKKQGLISI